MRQQGSEAVTGRAFFFEPVEQGARRRSVANVGLFAGLRELTEGCFQRELAGYITAKTIDSLNPQSPRQVEYMPV